MHALNQSADETRARTYRYDRLWLSLAYQVSSGTTVVRLPRLIHARPSLGGESTAPSWTWPLVWADEGMAQTGRPSGEREVLSRSIVNGPMDCWSSASKQQAPPSLGAVKLAFIHQSENAA